MQQWLIEAQAGLGDWTKPVLHHSELHFQRLLEHFPAGAYTCDREGLITYCNHQAVQLWGRAPRLHDPTDRFCGSFKLFSPEGSPIAHDQCWMALALRMNKAFSGHEIVIERPDGQRITVLAHANPIHDESGNLLGAVNILVDISDRQRTVEVVQTSERRFRALIEKSHEGIALLDADGTFLYHSPALLPMLGYAVEELLGRQFTTLIHADDVSTVRETFAALVSAPDATANLQFRYGHRDGTWRWLDVNYTNLLTDAAVHAIVANYRDMTAQKLAEEARAAEARFRQTQNDVAAVALSSLPPEVLMPRLLEAICRAQQYTYGWLWRVVEEGCAMVVVASFGEGTRPFLGYRQDSHLPDCFMAQVVCTGQAAFCNRMQQTPFSYHPITHMLGGQASLGIPLLDQTGAVLGMLDFMDTQRPDRFSAMDVEQGTILAHQVAQAIENSDLFSQLQQLQARDNAVMDTMHEAVYVVNLEGHIVFANPALARLSHYSLQDLLGQPSTMLFPPGVTPRILRRRREHLQGVDRVPYRQLTMLRKDGQQIDIEVSTTGLTVDGRVEGFVVVIRDITERLQLEIQLHQSQKMQEIGTLVGGIAHDFNNILAAVLGYADLTLSAVPRESVAWNNLQQILVAGERARHLVQQMLTFSRQAKQERKPLQLHLLVKEVLELLRAVFPATITLRQEIDLQTSTVLANPTQMQQVLMNLCTNAAHAMRQAGELAVRLDATAFAAESALPHPALRPGPYIRLTVCDTGHGMAPEVLERIFEPFFTTKDVGEGTGLGLAVVHGIITDHGGAITVESTPGQGTTFVIYLPRSASPSEVAPDTEAPIRKAQGRILFVDDEAALAHIGQTMLTHLGYDVASYTNSEEALAAFCSAPEHFDLVITDQTMPHLTGADLARALRGLRPDIPIILCTGYSQTMTAEQARQLGLNAFCMKPLRIRDLEVTLRRVLTQCRAGKN
jgi:PAS domain S-box-containing protein